MPTPEEWEYMQKQFGVKPPSAKPAVALKPLAAAMPMPTPMPDLMDYSTLPSLSEPYSTLLAPGSIARMNQRREQSLAMKEQEKALAEQAEAERVKAEQAGRYGGFAGQALVRGFETTAGTIGGLTALGGELVDSEFLKKAGIESSRYWQGKAAEIPGTQFKEISGVGSAAKWTLEKAIENAPFLIGTYGTGAIGKQVISRVIPKVTGNMLENMAKKKLAAGASNELVSKAAIKIAENLGAKAGMIGGVAAVESGGDYADMIERGLGSDAAALTTLGTGVVKGFVEMMGGPQRYMGKWLGSETGTTFQKALNTINRGISSGKKISPDTYKGAWGTVRRILGESMRIGSEEGMEEVLQEGLAIANIGYHDPDFRYWTAENFQRILEAGAGGFAVGAVLGAPGGMFTNAETYAKERGWVPPPEPPSGETIPSGEVIPIEPTGMPTEPGAGRLVDVRTGKVISDEVNLPPEPLKYQVKNGSQNLLAADVSQPSVEGQIPLDFQRTPQEPVRTPPEIPIENKGVVAPLEAPVETLPEVVPIPTPGIIPPVTPEVPSEERQVEAAPVLKLPAAPIPRAVETPITPAIPGVSKGTATVINKRVNKLTGKESAHAIAKQFGQDTEAHKYARGLVEQKFGITLPDPSAKPTVRRNGKNYQVITKLDGSMEIYRKGKNGNETRMTYDMESYRQDRERMNKVAGRKRKSTDVIFLHESRLGPAAHAFLGVGLKRAGVEDFGEVREIWDGIRVIGRKTYYPDKPGSEDDVINNYVRATGIDEYNNSPSFNEVYELARKEIDDFVSAIEHERRYARYSEIGKKHEMTESDRNAFLEEEYPGDIIDAIENGEITADDARSKLDEEDEEGAQQAEPVISKGVPVEPVYTEIAGKRDEHEESTALLDGVDYKEIPYENGDRVWIHKDTRETISDATHKEILKPAQQGNIPIEAKVTEKQSWEMTQTEWLSHVGYKNREGSRVRENWLGTHEGEVRVALQNNRPVPKNVIKSYPKLEKEYFPTKPPESTLNVEDKQTSMMDGLTKARDMFETPITAKPLGVTDNVRESGIYQSLMKKSIPELEKSVEYWTKQQNADMTGFDEVTIRALKETNAFNLSASKAALEDKKPAPTEGTVAPEKGILRYSKNVRSNVRHKIYMELMSVEREVYDVGEAMPEELIEEINGMAEEFTDMIEQEYLSKNQAGALWLDKKLKDALWLDKNIAESNKRYKERPVSTEPIFIRSLNKGEKPPQLGTVRYKEMTSEFRQKRGYKIEYISIGQKRKGFYYIPIKGEGPKYAVIEENLFETPEFMKHAEATQAALEGKSALEAIQWISDNGIMNLRPIALKVAQVLSHLESKGVKFTFDIVHVGDDIPNLLTVNRAIAIINGKKIDIIVNGTDVKGKIGIYQEAVLHEFVHAVTVSAINIGRMKVDPIYTANYRDLIRISNIISKHFGDKIKRVTNKKDTFTDFERNIYKNNINALSSPEEIIAWTLTNTDMQEYLETIPFQKGTLWTEFVKAIRKFLGLQPTADTALSEVLRVTETILGEQIVDYIGITTINGKNMVTQQAVGKWTSGKGELAPIEGPKYATEDTQWYYSQMQRTLESKLPNRGSASGFKKMIQSWADKGEFKTDELEWSGLLDADGPLAKEGPINKSDVVAWLEENNVRVEEVVRGETTGIVDQSRIEIKAVREPGEGSFVFETFVDGITAGLYYNTYEKAMAAGKDAVATPTKFAQWQIPGGEEYRELLLTLPDISEITPIMRKRIEDYTHLPFGQVTLNDLALAPKELKSAFQLHIFPAMTGTYVSPHFPERNILVHVRFNERTDADGNRVLFVEEIQSDWSQRARDIREKEIKRIAKERGITKTDSAEYKAIQKEVSKDFGYDIDAKRKGAMFKEMEQLRQLSQSKWKDYGENRHYELEKELNAAREGVPNAPFKKSWPLLAMKRMIRYAVENGYDSIAWTTGEMQAERYDLSKQIDRVEYTKDGKLIAYKKGMRDVEAISEFVSRDKIADYVGKDVAEKLNAQPEPTEYKSQVVSGIDLKIGGEGMKGFYDQILPAEVNKYVKKWGGRVGETKIKLRNPEGPLSGKEYDFLSDVTATVHSLTLTPSMREAALAGQPLFKAGEVKPQDAGITVADIEQMFPGAIVNTLPDGTFSITANGNTVAIEVVESITPNEAAFKVGYGYKYNPAQKKIVGSYHKGRIRIIRTGNKWHLAHEEYHWLKDIGIINKLDITALNHAIAIKNKIKANAVTEEQQATYIENGLKNRELERNTVLKKMFQKIQDFIDGLINIFHRTARGVMREIESGEILQRETFAQQVDSENNIRYTLQQSYNPKKTVKAYKLFETKKNAPGKLFPLFIGATKPVPIGEWVIAENQPTKGYSPRPGWHSGMLPVAPHLMRKDGTLSPSRVWAEIEIPDDTDWQSIADKSATKDIRDRVPTDGFYKFKVSRGQGLEWRISGAIKINKILTQEEVDNINSGGETGKGAERYGVNAVSSQTDTPEFKRWFGNSKVVDKDGKPLVVYHGTARDLTIFDIDMMGSNTDSGYYGIGFYFSSDPQIASYYAIRTGINRGSIMPVFLSMQNPFIVDWTSQKSATETKTRAKDIGVEFTMSGFFKNPEVLKDSGYDGVIAKRNEEESIEYIAFTNTQIKSATGNIGTFDINDPDIRYAAEDMERGAEEKFMTSSGEERYAAENRPLQTARQTVPQEVYEEAKTKHESIKTKLYNMSHHAKEGWFAHYVTPFSTRLEQINPQIKIKFRQFRNYLNQAIMGDVHAVELFMKATKRMSKDDQIVFDLARKNADPGMLQQMVIKYGISKEYAMFRKTMNKIYDRLIEVGYDVDYKKHLHPRVIKDPSGFLNYLYNTSAWGNISEAIKEEQKKQLSIPLTDNQKAHIANLVIRGFGGKRINFSAPGNILERKVQLVDANLNQFYHDSNTALMIYITNINKAIEARAFFGMRTSVQNAGEKFRKVMYSFMERQRNERIRDVKGIKGDFNTYKKSIKEESKEKQDELIKEYLNRQRIHFEAFRKKQNMDYETYKKDVKKQLKIAESDIKEHNIESSVNASIGDYIAKLIKSEELKPEQEGELTRLFQSFFNYRTSTGAVDILKNMGYATAMGNFSSAITQIGDLAFAMYNAGIFETAQALGQAVTGKSKITKKDLAIEKIAEEFSNPTKFSILLNKLFHLTGFEAMDRIGKEVLVSATISKYEKMSHYNEAKLRSILQKMIPSNLIEETISDLKVQKITDNVKLVAFNTMTDFQPVDLGEMPIGYIDHPGGRIFYMMKTYYIKQVDALRRESITKIQNGEVKEGIGNLIKFAALIMLMNATADEIRDFMFRRDTKLSDNVIDNFMRLFGVSRYAAWRLRDQGVKGALVAMFAPPIDFIESPVRDLKGILSQYKENKEIKEGDKKGIPKDYNIWNMQSWKSLPYAGQQMYWWFGGGHESTMNRRLSVPLDKSKQKIFTTQERVDFLEELKIAYASGRITVQEARAKRGQFFRNQMKVVAHENRERNPKQKMKQEQNK